MSNENTDPASSDALWDKRPVSYSEQELTTESLPESASRIALEIEEIEECVQMGALDVIDGFTNYSKHLKFYGLREHLTRAVENSALLDCPKREEWLDSCLARFRHFLKPCSVCYEATRELGHLVVANYGAKIVVDLNTIVRQRFWGIGFYSISKSRDHQIAHQTLNAALGKLASDVASVNRFCAEWSQNSTYLNTVSFSHHQRGNLFEQMVLGILNQLEPTVTQTSIYHDVRQWSDLRIIREGALRNVSIQVKFLHRISDQDVAENHPRAGKTIILSPLSIAAFLEQSFDPELYRCSWSQFLDQFPVRPKSTGGLGSQIYYLFEYLFESPRTHPLSPIIDVPYPIRLAIHLFVASQAAEIRTRALWRLAALRAAEIVAVTDPQ